jgi:phospholipase C
MASTPYNRTISWAGGKLPPSHVQTRERPQIILDHAGLPVALSNGVQFGNHSSPWHPAGFTGDWSYTHVQELDPRPELKTDDRAATAASGKKIDHFVVLLLENRAADHFFGCMDLPGFDSALNGTPGHIKPSCGTAKYVCPGAPGFSFFSPFFAKGANAAKYPYSEQAPEHAVAGGDAVQMFSKEQLPIKAAMAKEYGVFNKLFASVPGASMPNHLFIQSGTSCGVMANVNGGWNGSTCGGTAHGFPQRTIYDSLSDVGKTFKQYINLTDVRNWTGGQSTGSFSGIDGINFPDTMMDGVSRYANSSFFNYSMFFEDAREGTLPNFSMVMPNASYNDHPCHDIALGERLVKDIYEALRAGPAWQKTLFLTVYDDTGGFYDHVIPPHEGVPADEAPCGAQNSGCPAQFDFKRLGSRLAAFVASPWIAKGAVIQEPQQGPMQTSQFELSSIPATAKTLFDLPDFLTKRDAWSGSFEELLLDSPRPDSDCPMHLPEAPHPWTPPPAPHYQNVTCGDFVPGDGCTGGKYDTLIVEWSSEEQCKAACEAKANAIGEKGCCWHTPVERNASSCEWISNGRHDVAGSPTTRSAADCTGTPSGGSSDGSGDGGGGGGGVNMSAEVAVPLSGRRNLRELQPDSHRRPQHCPAQDPGQCPEGGVSVAQRRKVAELAASAGVRAPPTEKLNAMGPGAVNVWLAQTLAEWLSNK